MAAHDFVRGEYTFKYVEDYSAIPLALTNRVIALKDIFTEQQHSLVSDIYIKPDVGEIVELGANPGYLIYLGSLLVGFAVYSQGYEYGRNVFTIDELYIEKLHRGKGLGRAVLERMLEIAYQIENVQIFISTVANNEAAIKLYESVGFKPLHVDLTMSR